MGTVPAGSVGHRPRAAAPFGARLREWRLRRRYSQLALALEAGTSARHLSFLETGRAAPSRDMVHRLAEHLEVPLRERNALLLAAGYAPAYRERPLEDPAMRTVGRVLDGVLAGFEPFPALAVDRRWNVVSMNRSVGVLLDGVAPHLLEPPVNALRASLHPDGLAARIVNLAQWRAFVLRRLQREAEHAGDAELHTLLDELRGYDRGSAAAVAVEEGSEGAAVAVPLVVRSQQGELSFISTTTVFGTATDVTLAELAIECFLPADERTRQILQQRTR